MKILVLAGLTFLLGNPATAKVRTLDPSHTHPAPGTSIVRFAEVDKGVYRGSTPKNKADFRFLQSKHIKYIIDLEFWPLLSLPEKSKARKNGIVFISALISGSPITPSEKHVNRILATLRDAQRHPVYFHCVLGRDRTGLIAALYKMYFLGMPRETAWEEMRAFGFKDSWTLRGLKNYFNQHPKPPRSLATAVPLP